MIYYDFYCFKIRKQRLSLCFTCELYASGTYAAADILNSLLSKCKGDSLGLLSMTVVISKFENNTSQCRSSLL